jgi:predicted Rossmann fold flavoprotein
MTQKFEAIIIGAGAAGLMCAITAAQRGRSVLILEHNREIGKKILISGGGRCNFTNLTVGPENYISRNPDFCRSALARYRPESFISLIEQHGIEFYEKKLGQLFCRISSKQIVELLEKECRQAEARIQTNCVIKDISLDNEFKLQTTLGSYECDSLVIATGALSFPKLGASDFGYRIARQFNIPIINPRPGLVPVIPQLLDKSPWPFKELAGISLECVITAGGQSFNENLLFTHQGLSGPAILQASNYCPNGETFTLNLLPELDHITLLKMSQTEKQKPAQWLEQWFPKRAAGAFAQLFAPNEPLAQMKQTSRDKLIDHLLSWKLIAKDNEGYDKAEVTVGGIDTAALSSKTMACKNVNGLFFIGEILDVTGWLGGYNFQWAWASGHAAGEII